MRVLFGWIARNAGANASEERRRALDRGERRWELTLTAILRRTPDHEDLVTATDSEVLCRVVGRWVGQGGKASLANTADADQGEDAERGTVE